VAQFSSSLIIAELSATGSVLRSATLVGPALPFMGAKWGIENRLVTSWYPGNQEEATQQYMGRTELPSQWSGHWSPTMMSRAPSRILDVTTGQGGTDVTSPFQLWSFLEAMFSSGRRLRVTWALDQQDVTNFSGKIVREGRCKKLVPSFGYNQNIDWEVEFEWVSRGTSTSKVATPRDASISNNSAQLANALAALVAANQLNADTVTPSALTIGQLETLASTPTLLASQASRTMLQLQSDLQNIVGLGATLQQQPISVQKAAVAMGQNAQTAASSSYLTLSQAAPETFSTQDDAISVLQAWGNFAQMQDAAVAAWLAAWLFSYDLRRSLPVHSPVLAGELGPQSNSSQDTILDTYVVKQGDSMHRISMRFYGTPDHTADICRANALSWHTVLPTLGSVLLIPRLSSIAQTT
jgi:hypothetical protein